MDRFKRAAWVGLVALVAFTLVFAPSRTQQPALPEPGARRILATVFGGDE